MDIINSPLNNTINYGGIIKYDNYDLNNYMLLVTKFYFLNTKANYGNVLCSDS